MTATPSSLAPPIPPVEMRALVGPLDAAAFDNVSGRPVFADVAPSQYEAVLDFGCGCGRVARQLIQQDPRPDRYLGIDPHRGMITWCRDHLVPHAGNFRFEHHDVHETGFNPAATSRVLPFPCGDGEFTLAIACSVFTHLLEDQVPHYLREIRRALRPDGVAITTWFFFEKGPFPMMQQDQNALYINPHHPTNAVIYDREWFTEALATANLMPVRITPPDIRGFQWTVVLAPLGTRREPARWPPDEAPLGLRRPPNAGHDPHLIGVRP